ncbi:MAG: hypothetical protein ACRC3H_11945 [Lachnospiraceae bacterium]
MKNLVKNFIYAFGSQLVSLSATLVITLIAPALIGVKQFAYWQLFLTYVTYVNISRFGLNDGLYLRLGGKKYEELDYKLLSHERQVFIGFQIAAAISIMIVITIMDLNSDRTFVLIACCVCIIIINANGFLIYILQAVNLTRIYSVSLILQNLTWFIAVGIIVLLRVYSYKVIIIMYILGHICAGVYLMCNAREIVRHKYVIFKVLLKDIKENIGCGIKLMIATYAGSFIIASVQMIVDAYWGVEVFGYFSFSLTLANVFLTFVNQVSIVIFPALRRIKPEHQNKVYFSLRTALSFILPLVMLGYLPITIFVQYCLPQYTRSLGFLPMFLPICTFDGKMQMMCSSFFKSMRKETTLLRINLITLGGSIVMALLGSFIVKNIYFVSIGILIVVALRSIVSELILAKAMNTNIYPELLQEILIVVLFVIGSFLLPSAAMFFLYLFIYLIYLLANKNRVKAVFALRRSF